MSRFPTGGDIERANAVLGGQMVMRHYQQALAWHASNTPVLHDWSNVPSSIQWSTEAFEAELDSDKVPSDESLCDGRPPQLSDTAQLLLLF